MAVSVARIMMYKHDMYGWRKEREEYEGAGFALSLPRVPDFWLFLKISPATASIAASIKGDNAIRHHASESVSERLWRATRNGGMHAVYK